MQFNEKVSSGSAEQRTAIQRTVRTWGRKRHISTVTDQIVSSLSRTKLIWVRIVLMILCCRNIFPLHFLLFDIGNLNLNFLMK